MFVGHNTNHKTPTLEWLVYNRLLMSVVAKFVSVGSFFYCFSSFLISLGIPSYCSLCFYRCKRTLNFMKHSSQLIFIYVQFLKLICSHRLPRDNHATDNNKCSKNQQARIGYTYLFWNHLPRIQLAGWLFWVYRPFETVFQSISGRFPKRGRKK